MLTIEAHPHRARRAGTRTGAARLPLLVLIGFVVLVLGGIADVVAHDGVTVGAHEAGHQAGHTADEIAAHVQVFVGMVLILLGVVVDGVRQTRLGHRASSNRKGVS